MGVPEPSRRTFILAYGLPGSGTVMQVWQTTASARFVRLADAILSSDGSLVLDLPADGIVTASTVTGASHGVPSVPIPPPAPLALPYSDGFDEATYAYDALPRYLSDQGGSFAVRNGSLVQTVHQRPGSNDWYTTPDPITLLGDYTPWADVSVGVSVVLPSSPAEAALTTDYLAQVATCESSGGSGGDGVSEAQAWALGTLFPSSVSNTLADGQQLCLNLKGCTTDVVYYQCCNGTCGCSGGDGFKFTLQKNGSLTAALFPGLCATVTPGSPAVTLAPCSTAAGGSMLQEWAYISGTQKVVNTGTGQCLTSPLRPQRIYAQVCARVTGYSGFQGIAPVPGICLQVRAEGFWFLVAGGTAIANGTIAPLSGHSVALQLTVKGTYVRAFVAGQALGQWDSGGVFTAGMVAFGSGVHAAAFDDFFVAPA